jgi:RNA polymerase sigma-70 factor (ECF subfamily)
MGTDASDDASQEAAWLEAFWRGNPAAIEACYRRHFATVKRAVGAVLGGADRETVVQEVFARLIGSEEQRRAFAGGSFDAWIATVARNMAINHSRRLGRETGLDVEASDTGTPWQEAADARLLVEKFRREHLRPEWQGVFETRFLRQLTQHEASRALGVSRTTLAYRELRIRHALRHFLLEDES